MLVLLPALFFFMTSVALDRYFKTGWRIALLVSALLTGTLIVFMTEILSLFRFFSFYPVTLVWFAATIVSIGFAWRSLFSGTYRSPDNPLFDEQLLWYFVKATLVITGITAVFSTPNTWDSMSYHLPRVEHWIQNKTIAYYPTHILRQLYYCPWAEFAMAHLRLLCPWESIVNLLQWFAMAGSLVCVSLIVKQLGGSQRGQLVACLVAVTLPMGILQSVSTQNDYVETFWLLCFIFFVKEIHTNFRMLYVFSAGLSLGLALLTKGYGYILMIPFLILLIVSISGHARRIKTIFIIILCVLALNSGYYARNQEAFGSLTSGKESLLVSSFDLKGLVGNLLRNFGQEMDTPFAKVNKLLSGGLAQVCGWLGIDFLYDPHAAMNTYADQNFHRSESYCGNFLHMILFTGVVLLCWFMPRSGRGLRLYTALICGVGILFCLVVRYQNWVTRFHLPMFIMFCPVFGIFMDRILSYKKMIVLGQLFILDAVLFLFLNPFHPWFGPDNIWHQSKINQYFISMGKSDGPVSMRNYVSISGQIRDWGCHEVGIISNPESWEYPLWVLLKTQRSGNNLRIEHVNVNNASGHIPYPLGDFKPCAVVTIKNELRSSHDDKNYGTVEKK